MVVDEGMGGMCLIDPANVVYDALYKFKCGGQRMHLPTRMFPAVCP